MTLQKDHAYLMKVQGREWALSINEEGAWNAVPGDENPFSQTDLTKLAHYLRLEGWLDENFEAILSES